MNEPVNPIVATLIIFPVHPWRAQDLEAKLFSTVNQTDIRVLLAAKRAGTHDCDSSGAASIF
jgi:hypothetical protein